MNIFKFDGKSEDEENLKIQSRDAILGSSLKKLTEYGRPVHAEMSALMSCAKNGISVDGATLYCSTFPCHNYAKHIISAGIKRIVYIEPYPKSHTYCSSAMSSPGAPCHPVPDTFPFSPHKYFSTARIQHLYIYVPAAKTPTTIQSTLLFNVFLINNSISNNVPPRLFTNYIIPHT